MLRLNRLLTAILVLSLLVLAAGSSLLAQSTSSPEANKVLLLAFWEAENARNYDQMGDFFTSDLVRHSVATASVMPEIQIHGLTEYVAFLQGMAAGFPDYVTTALMLTAEGDYVAFYAMWTGTSAETGNTTGGPMVGFARFEDGKMAELWVEWDSLTWTRQMMAAPGDAVEAPISSIDDVVGAWNFTLMGDTYRLEIAADGTGVIYAPEGLAPRLNDPQCPTCVERFTFTVKGGQIHYLTSALEPALGEALYQVYVTRQAGQRVSLRFELIGEDTFTERVMGTNGQTLPAAES